MIAGFIFLVRMATKYIHLIYMDTLHTPLSQVDILRRVPDCKFILYEDMHKVRNIKELLPKCLILYQLAEVGHFCCVFENNELGQGTINFFDPLGLKTDDELKKINPVVKYELYHDFPYLTKLLYDSGRSIVYNQYRLQKRGTATCGHFCAIRLNYSYLHNEEFREAFKQFKGIEKEIKAVELFERLP